VIRILAGFYLFFCDFVTQNRKNLKKLMKTKRKNAKI